VTRHKKKKPFILIILDHFPLQNSLPSHNTNCGTGTRVATSNKEIVPHEVYTEVLPYYKAQWPVEYQRKIKEEEKYQKQVPRAEA